jgi:esterase
MAVVSSLSAARLAGSGDPSRHLVMLHGIYGRGRNWQAIARLIVAGRPEYVCWLVDLPHHGKSGPGAHGDTVQGLARDLDDWVAAERIRVDVILGHSFGGKVALAYAANHRDERLQVWIIDSTPDTTTPSGSAWAMLEVVRSLPRRFRTRDEAIDAIAQRGFARPVATWMATNLERRDGGFEWRLDFAAMEALLRDFFATDLRQVVLDASPAHDIFVVKASESHAISADAVTRLRAASRERVHVFELPGGHWIHAESPEAVAKLLVDHLR